MFTTITWDFLKYAYMYVCIINVSIFESIYVFTILFVIITLHQKTFLFIKKLFKIKMLYDSLSKIRYKIQ